MEEKKFKISSLIFWILSLSVLLYVVWTLGKPLQFPWEFSVDVYQPKYASVDDTGKLSAFSDNDLLRISYLNYDELVEKTDNLSLLTNDDQRYYNVSSYDSKTYYLYVEYDPQTGYLTNETIKCRQDNVDKTEEIYYLNYDPLQEKLKRPQILDLLATENGLYVLLASPTDNNCIKVLKIKDGEISEIKKQHVDFSVNTIKEACYNPVCDKIGITQNYGYAYVIDGDNNLISLTTGMSFNYGCPAILDDGSILISDMFTTNLYCIKDNIIKTIAKDVLPDSIQFENGYLTVCDSMSSSIKVYEDDQIKTAFETDKQIEPTKEIENAAYCPWLIVYSIFTWLSYLYIFISLIIILIKAFNEIRLKDTTKVYIKMGIGLIIVVILVCCFFTSNLYIQAENSAWGRLKTATLNACSLNKDDVNNLSFDYNNQNTNIDKYANIINNNENLVETFAKGNIGINIETMTKKELTNFDLSYSKIQKDLPEISDEVFIVSTNNPSDMITFEAYFSQGYNLTAIMPITDSNNQVSGLVIAWTPVKQILITQIYNCLNYIILFLIIGATLVLGLMEFKAIKENFMTSLKVKRKKSKEKLEICGSRLFSFVYHLIYCIDLALVILIAKDILSDSDILFGTVTLSIPISLYAFGDFIGTTLAQSIIKKLSARCVFVSAALFHLLAELVVVFSIVNSDFILFSVMKFITGISIGVLSFIVNIIQYQAKDYHEQSKIANNSALALISSSALSSMIAGALSDNFGNEGIYIFTALLCAVFIIASFWYLPKGLRFNNKRQKSKSNNLKSSTKDVIKFFISPTMIVVVLCTCFIASLAYQYNSVLYPLFADDAGLSKTNIGNITMLAICVVFFINTILKKYLTNKKQTVIVTITMLVFAIPLLCFGLNHSIIWASLTLITITFAYRVINVSQKLIWVPLAQKSKLNEEKIYMILIQIKMICTTIAPTIFSMFIYFGHAESAIIIGCICLVFTGIFWIVTKTNKEH